MTYRNDGGVVSSAVPKGRPSGVDEHYKMFGIFRGQIVRVIYPDSTENINKGRIEYVVRVNGQDYPNAISMNDLGGIYQQQETIHKPIEKSTTGKVNTAQYPENLDGEMVFVMFIEGHGNIPLIIGCAEHPRAEKKFTKLDGIFDYKQFNGLEFSIDKESNYLIKHVGRKDPEGKILNQPAVDSQLKMFGNGDVEINTHGTQTTEDLRMKFTKEVKKFELYAQNNKAVLDQNGIKITDKFGSFTELKSGEVQDNVVGNWVINISGNATVTIGGDADINVTGKTTLDAAEINFNGAAGDILTTVTDPIIDSIYGAPTTGVPTVKAG